MKAEKERIRVYMSKSAGEKLKFLLHYKIFVKKATSIQNKELLVTLKKRVDYPSSDFPPSITSSE